MAQFKTQKFNFFAPRTVIFLQKYDTFTHVPKYIGENRL